ncbi:hypothetical protein A3715_09285 [Oleiphilus sp. HI0009]|uniref:DUF3187 family protein n=3 Tax=Oleiphilus TaxID=141450 RepID=UPI0007C31CA1|nr:MULTISPECIES: DUF3187 family protein [unclassified Oleiphilus]KZX79006.1 hypothetical protein A3715_09285 [Oleiphilus sp. HI0009]KZY62046.1 hypothetical protein A3738_13140 [Oleiphilus sp. HI0066]KZY69674.1 hypothetical protein A3739_08480 [Oleiphilus sp. HI0067]
MLRSQSLISALIILFLSLFDQRAYASKIQYVNLNPLIGQLPYAHYPSAAQKQSKMTFETSVAISNYFRQSTVDQTTYDVDGETSLIRETLTYRTGTLSLGLSLQYQAHRSGYLDDPIYEFHDVFGMPQNGREQSTNNQLNWNITKNGETYKRIDRSHGLGDTMLFVEMRPTSFISDAVSLSFNLPTGDTSKQTGGLASSINLSFATQGASIELDNAFLPRIQTSYGYNVSYLRYKSMIDEFSPNPFVGGAYGSLDLIFTPTIALITNIDINTPYFNDEVRELGWTSIALSSALSFDVSRHNIYIGFSEDIRPSTTPDFSLFFGLTTNL